MDYQKELAAGSISLAVVGLGYVGIPLAAAFSRHFSVIGYDRNPDKIAAYQNGIDPTGEVGNDGIRACHVRFTSDAGQLRDARFIVVAVPTPINQDKTPDLTPVVEASREIAKYLSSGTIVVYESTVYPGVTENVCIPLLEEGSSLSCGRDFYVGYSPERINPADKVHTLQTIRKIVSGMDNEVCDQIARVYDTIITAGTYRVSSIKTAEAIKVAENSQRDINIAFMNELAMVFDRMGIDTSEVVDGMNTKWNALGFRPGLVGGHCIGVDPYYFTYEAEKLGYHSRIILAGRQINDGMGQFVADAALREMSLAGLCAPSAKVAVLGLTFKENCADIRNSKVVDILRRLAEYGVRPLVYDPFVQSAEAEHEYGIALTPIDEIRDVDCVILAVAHDQFKQGGIEAISALFGNNAKILIDVKSVFSLAESSRLGIRHWRL